MPAIDAFPAPEVKDLGGTHIFVKPPNISSAAEVIYDPEEGAVIGFIYYKASDNITFIYDINGEQIDIIEPPIEEAIGPVEAITTVIGLGQIAIGGSRLITRHIAAGTFITASRAIINAALDLRAVALREIYRKTLTKNDILLKYSKTTLKNFRRPGRFVPEIFIKHAIRKGRVTPDPMGVPGRKMYRINMWRSSVTETSITEGSLKTFKIRQEGELEVLVNERQWIVEHFAYKNSDRLKR